MPFNPDSTAAYNNINAYSAGEAVLAANNQITVATAKMKGEFNPLLIMQTEMLCKGNQFFELIQQPRQH